MPGQLPGPQGNHNPPLPPLLAQEHPCPSISQWAVGQPDHQRAHPRERSPTTANKWGCFYTNAHYLPSTDCAQQPSIKPHKNPLNESYQPHFTEEAMEAQRGRVTFPKSHSQEASEVPGGQFQPRRGRGMDHPKPLWRGGGRGRACIVSSLLGHDLLLNLSVLCSFTHSWTLSTCLSPLWALRAQVNQAHLCFRRAHCKTEWQGKLRQAEATTCLGLLVFTEGLL